MLHNSKTSALSNLLQYVEEVIDLTPQERAGYLMPLADQGSFKERLVVLLRFFACPNWMVARGKLLPIQISNQVGQEVASEMAAEFSASRGREKRDWTDESVTDRIDVAAKRFPKTSVMLLHMAMFNIYRHASEVLQGTYFSAMHFWGLMTIGRARPKSQGDLVQILSEHQFSVLMSTIFTLTAFLECIGEYVGAPDFAEKARVEFDRIQELPLIREALSSDAEG